MKRKRVVYAFYKPEKDPGNRVGITYWEAVVFDNGNPVVMATASSELRLEKEFYKKYSREEYVLL